MGAARLGQTVSDAVIVTARRPLTWADTALRNEAVGTDQGRQSDRF